MASSSTRSNGHGRKVILGVFAHPDDESFGPGGTLARYAGSGCDVHIIIATDGIAGSVEKTHQAKEHESLAQVRSAELANAAVALGVASVWSLPYRDSGMRGSADNAHPDALINAPIATLVGEMVDAMQRLQPDVVITHDPFGGYGHPDHIRVCEAVSAAFYSVRGPQKLYYTAFDKRWLKVMVRLMPLWGADPTAIGRNKDIDLVEISRWHTPVHTSVDIRDWLDVKEAASRAHTSQYGGGPSWAAAFPGPLRRRVLGFESFTRACPPPGTELESDLLAGLQ
jgi:LmbE family N-acetylglucosaminyl deacetylase